MFITISIEVLYAFICLAILAYRSDAFIYLRFEHLDFNTWAEAESVVLKKC